MNTRASTAGARHRVAIPCRARVAAVLSAVAALTAACGSQGGASRPVSPGGTVTKPASSLVISVAAARGDTPRHWTLTCGRDVAGGTLPHPAAACAALARAKDPFAPVGHGIMCSMIDSGPQTASITGTWHGTRVASSYSRLDSCESARWNKLWKVFGQVNPGGRMIPTSSGPPSN
jgi:Subtilisin inhibitor-like